KTAGIFSRLLEKFKSRFFTLNGSTGVFKGEVFKFTIQNKMAVMIVLLVLFAIISSFGTVRYPYSENSDADYKAYMEYLEGDITLEKENYILEQQNYFNNLQQRMGEIAENSELSENAKQAMSKSIENILNSKGVAFKRVIEQYNRLLELDKKGIDAKFIDENIYKSFVSSKTREWNDFALLCLVLVIGVPYVFSPEYKNGMINLIRTTENGKTKLFFGKIVVECIYLLIAFTALYVPYFVRFINTYGANSLNTPLVCIFENVQETSFSVINAVVVNLICYFLLATAVTFVITAVSIFTRSSMFTMVISTVLVIIPLLALYLIENARLGYWVVNSHIIAIVMTCLLSILIAIVTLEISKLKFTETRIWRRINAKA
ncbi:hypothetical protein, partial [Ruminococcus sp.]